VNANTPATQTFVVNGGQYVAVAHTPALAAIVPHAKIFEWRGMKMLLLPNLPEEARVARNLGVMVPSPILTRYDWRGTKPWDIQRTTAALLAESARCYVLSSMGTGKTRAVIYAADYLIRMGFAHRILVVAPLSTLTPVWEKEFFDLGLSSEVRILYGNKDKRLKLLREQKRICVINHHGLRVMGDDMLRGGFDIVVFDELAIYRNRTTQLWKFAAQLVNSSTTKFAWGLTGSPTPNAPTDAWAQMRLLTPANTTRSFVAFRDQTMRRITSFKWVPRPEANEIVHTGMNPSVRYTREDVMELPECSYVDRHVQLETDAAKAYRLMYDRSRMITHTGKEITAVNEGVLQNKLLQVSCGYLYANDKTVYALPSAGRLSALEEVLDETDHKSIVMVPYLHALDGVAAHLRKKGYDIAVVHGGVGRSERDTIFNDFQAGPSPHILVAHPQCLAHGLTLTQADTIVWYSPTQSLEIYEQANARINRPGQKNVTYIVHMIGTHVERATYARLKSKQSMQNCLLSLFKEQPLAF
jgi:SNF2 family DNA or RNA helicase